MPLPTPVASDTTLPRKTSVAVLGGGVAGICTALELVERGIEVAVFEKGIVAGEQSSRNWGWVRQTNRDPRELPLMRIAMELWRGITARVGAETGFRTCGILYLSATEEEFAVRQKWHATHVKSFGLLSRLVDAAEAKRLQPTSALDWRGGLYTPDDGRAEPALAVSAIAEAFKRQGGHLFANTAVRGYETTAGRISAIVTERGRVACDTLVVAGGAWSRRFLGNHGIDFPQLAVLNSVMRTEPLNGGPEISSSALKFAVRKRLDGGYTIAHRHLSVADIVPSSFRQFFRFLPALMLDPKGLRLRLGSRLFNEAAMKRRWRPDETTPFEHVRILDPAPVRDILDTAQASIGEAFPVFREARIAERWAGMIDATPDAVPVISALPQTQGLYLVSGFSGHGFGLGPGAGKLAADLIAGETPCADPAPFRYTRFFDGSRPRPLAGL